jgi:lysophospholipase L1-like esterase
MMDWDWIGIVGTGQSLSVGTLPVSSTTQPHGHLKLSLGPSGQLTVPPWNPDAPELSMVPLVEPIRPLTTAYPSPYPENIVGETGHAAMAREITRLGRAAGVDPVTVHTVVGENGQGIAELEKHARATTGITGRAYAALLFEVAAITRLARAAGKTYGVAVIVLTHGETDSASPTYGRDLVRLLADANRDLASITGQTRKIPMYVWQQHALPNGPDTVGERSLSTQTQWELGRTHRGDFVCVGPHYQMRGHDSHDGVHLSATGYQMLGEKVGALFQEREVLGNDWQPLQPVDVARSGARTVVVRFHVPVGPLAWDTTFDPAALEPWARARGFELFTEQARVPIEAVAIADDAVHITAVADLPQRDLRVGYAAANQGVQLATASHAVRWGQLRDSDPFVGSTTGLASPNYAVSFVLPVPHA